MHLPSNLFFIALTCAALICWVNADDQHIDDVNGQLDSESFLDDTELTSNDEEDRQFNTFSQQCLQAHNYYRRKHGVPSLVLNQKMTAVAQNWANTLAARNIFVHSRTRGYGENIYASTSRSVTGIDPVNLFYSEIKYYRYRAPGFSKATGHFTQVVWKSSKSIGVGVAKGLGGTTFVVVNYYPPGNYKGQFRANVPRPR